MVLAHSSHGLPAILRELSQVRVHLEAMALMNPEAPVIPPQQVFVMVLFASVQIAFLWVDPSVRCSCHLLLIHCAVCCLDNTKRRCP